MEMIIIWSCVVAAAIIIEVETFALLSSWFAGGGMVSLILAALDVSWEWQVVAFVVVSFGLLVGCRPFLTKFLKTPTVPTNADVNLGKKFKLLADVKGGRSSVNINDVVWTVQVDGEFKAGDFVVIKDISGNKYIAEGIEKTEKVEKVEKSEKIEKIEKVEKVEKTGKKGDKK